MTTVELLPLPGTKEFLHGYYGLEECLVRGIVRITHPWDKPLYLKSLTVTLNGLIWVKFTDPREYTTIKRERNLFQASEELLKETDLEPTLFDSDGYVEFPFQIGFPAHEPVTASVGPSPQLLPPSSVIFGTTHYGNPYEAHTNYTLSVSLQESNTPFTQQTNSTIFPFWNPRAKVVSIPISPFLVYDPVLLPQILHPDIRRWRSSPGATPIEYDMEVGSIFMGPNDPIQFAYRIIVDDESARRGVRIKKVSFVLRELYQIGEGRCCSIDDDSDWNYDHPRPSRIRSVTELLRWDRTEHMKDESKRNSSESLNIEPTFELHKIKTEKACSKDTPEELTRPGTRLGGGDGIHAENSTIIKVPSFGGFVPSTARPVIPPDDHSCKYIRPRAAQVQVKHSIQVVIELYEAERVVMESPCYLTCIGRDEATRLLDDDPEILPVLDYDKLVGLEVWLPEYKEAPSPTRQDPYAVSGPSEWEVHSRRPSVSQLLILPRHEQLIEDAAANDVPDSPTPPYTETDIARNGSLSQLHVELERIVENSDGSDSELITESDLTQINLNSGTIDSTPIAPSEELAHPTTESAHSISDPLSEFISQTNLIDSIETELHEAMTTDIIGNRTHS